MRANQLRLWFASFAYVLLAALRRIKIAMASACPYQTEYHIAYLYLRRAAAF